MSGDPVTDSHSTAPEPSSIFPIRRSESGKRSKTTASVIEIWDIDEDKLARLNRADEHQTRSGPRMSKVKTL
jgi:hypothetical protein